MTPLPAAFAFKRPPRAHQRKVLLNTWDKTEFALLMEQRTGKTKVVLDNAVALWHAGKVRNLVVVAPMGIHSDWLNIHARDDVSIPFAGFVWRSGKAKGVEYRRRLEKFMAVTDRLRIFTMNDEAVHVEACLAALRLLMRTPTMIVFDESDEYAAGYRPKAKRMKLLTKLKTPCPYRRILTGTPVEEGPLDIYGQLLLIQDRPLDHENYWAFRNHYGVWEKAYAAGGRHTFLKLASYQNLGDLQKRLRTISVEVKRSDCADLPPKQPAQRSFSLSAPHATVYDQMRESILTGLDEPSPLPLAGRVLTGLVRLQQIASGFLPNQKEEHPCPACSGAGQECEICEGTGVVFNFKDTIVLPGDNARVETLLHELYKEPALRRPSPRNKVLIWCRFHYDVDMVLRNLPEEWQAVRFDGTVSPDERDAAKHTFALETSCRALVGNPLTGGRGTDLSAADLVVYYSHHWSLRMRKQSEDRAISLVKTNGVGYLDLVAENTIDVEIMDAQHHKRELMKQVMGNPDPAHWFRKQENGA